MKSKSLLLTLSLSLFFSPTINAQKLPWKANQASFGGSDNEEVIDHVLVYSANIIVVGNTHSHDGDVTNYHGQGDIWVSKFYVGDLDTLLIWERSFGGAYTDVGVDVEEISDNNEYLFGGTVFTPSGGNSGDITGAFGSLDYWIVKIDEDGQLKWKYCFGGTANESLRRVLKTSDGGFIAIGSSTSVDGQVTGHHGASFKDTWVVRLNSLGILQWQLSIGGTNDELPLSVIETNDTDFIVLSASYSNDGNAADHHGDNTTADYLVTKINSNGTVAWNRSWGGSANEGPSAGDIDKTSDGHYLLMGHTSSEDGDVTGLHGSGNTDVWSVKFDENGNILYTECYGGTDDEQYSQNMATEDGNHLLACTSNSFDFDVTGNHGNDAWILKLNDVNGNIIWSKCFGGSYVEDHPKVSKSWDDNYLLQCNTYSNDGDVMGFHGTAGSPYADTWVVKMSHSDGNIMLRRCIGGSNHDASYVTGNGSALIDYNHNYFVVTNTLSDNGDVETNHGAAGTSDIWFSYLDEQCYGFVSVTIGPGDTFVHVSVAMTTGVKGYSYRYREAGSPVWITGTTRKENLSIGDLEPNTAYEWQGKVICTVNPHLTSDLSGIIPFTTSNRLGVEETGNPAVAIYPNPFRVSAEIAFTLNEGSHVTIELFNISNQKVKTVLDEFRAEGNYTATIENDGLTAGVYMVRLIINDEVINRKLIIE